MSFPKGFLIGAATAAHQVEGNNVHSDYWAQEQMKYSSFAEPSLDACDHYNRFEEDIALMARAGLNAYRFSIIFLKFRPIWIWLSLEPPDLAADIICCMICFATCAT